MKSNLAWHFSFCREAFGLVPTLFWFVVRPMMDLLRPSTWHFYRMDKGFKLPPKQGLRVMLVASDCSQGSGAFRCCVGLAKTLRERNHLDVFVVTPWHGDGDVLLREASVPFVCIPSSDFIVSLKAELALSRSAQIAKFVRNILAVQNLRRTIRRLDVDIVHNNTSCIYVGALAAFLEKRPLVWHFREYITEGTKARIINERMAYELMAKANCILTVSDWVRGKFANVLPTGKLKTVHDGGDKSRFLRLEHVAATQSPMVFISVGSYRDYKGYDELAHACVSLYKSGCRNFRICFVGKGCEENLLKIFEKDGLRDLVEFCGFQREPVKFYEHADIAFTCCRAEAFGLVTVESMLSGCCVIGARAAATPELIRHGETGLLFEFTAGECPDLVEKMRYAIEHPEHVRRMAAAGRAYVCQGKTLEVNADKVAAVYRQIQKA